MPRYAIEIAYDGASFKGWQAQPGERSVQEAVERALVELGCGARIHGAGRTDAGVHARAQVAHFDHAKCWEPRRLTLALNACLPASVSVMRSAVVARDFDARRSAVAREYRYFIWNASTCYPHIRPYVLWLRGAHYDWARARAAARMLVGEHDFRAFCRLEDCPDATRRAITHSKIARRGSLIVYRVRANAFLTNMIRIAVGNILHIAEGKRDDAWLRALLSGVCDRRASAQTVSPDGLFFWRATYPQPIEWG